MHMADAMLSAAVAGTMYAASAGAAAYSVIKIKNEDNTRKIPLMGVMGAFVFSTQMLNFTIPGTGASGHLCGGLMLTALLGPAGGFLTMLGILLVQALFFADGGLLALGANLWNMAFYGCFIGGLLIWKPIMRKGITRSRIITASFLGCVITLQMGALSVTLETLLSGIAELPFHLFVSAMQPIHLLIGLVEGMITVAVLIFVHEARPELLWTEGNEGASGGKFSFKTTIVVLAVTAVFFAGALSLAASSNPDGLEWSMRRVAGTDELQANGELHEAADRLQTATAILPDYSLKDSDAAVGTSLSGIVGGLIVVAFCVGMCRIIRLFRKKNQIGT